MSDKVCFKLSKENLELIDEYVIFSNEMNKKNLNRTQLINELFTSWAFRSEEMIKQFLKSGKMTKKAFENINVSYEKLPPKGSGVFCIILSPYHKKSFENMFRFSNISKVEQKLKPSSNMSEFVQELLDEQILGMEREIRLHKLQSEQKGMVIEELNKTSEIEEIG